MALPPPLPVISNFCAAAFQSALPELTPPEKSQLQLLPMPLVVVVLPRLVSVSLRSKQYDHCARAVALPSAVAKLWPPGVVGSTAESIETGS